MAKKPETKEKKLRRLTSELKILKLDEKVRKEKETELAKLKGENNGGK